MKIESKSILAKLMASEDITVVQDNVPTAFFDLKERILTIPVLDGNLSNDLYDMIIGHEVSHALNTPMEGWHDAIVELGVRKSILNVCEDVRIEKKIKLRFPGLKPSFIRGYKELIEKDFFDTKNRSLNSFNFIDRVNLYTKGGPDQGIQFSDEEFVILRQIESANTFEETVAAAKVAQEYMKNENSETDKSSYDAEEELSEEDDTGFGGGTEGSYDPRAEAMTDQIFRFREKELFNKGKEKVYTYTIPLLKMSEIVVDHETIYNLYEQYNKNYSFGKKVQYRPDEMVKNWQAFRQESNKVVNLLSQQFELHKNAKVLAKEKVSKTGIIDDKKLFGYKVIDDMFLQTTTVPRGKNHGLVLYLDWSGSMSTHLNETIKQLLTLVMFCKKQNIPFEVYAFSSVQKSMVNLNFRGSISTYLQPKLDYIVSQKDTDIIPNNFCLLNILSSRMNSVQFVYAASVLLDIQHKKGHAPNSNIPEWFNLGGTPLSEAMLTAFQIVDEFKHNNRLDVVNVVVLSDGEGSIFTSKKRDMDVGETNVREYIVDPVTRATILCGYNRKMKRSNSFRSSAQIDSLLYLLKQRLGCNIIGFYICNGRDFRNFAEIYTQGNEIDSAVAKFGFDRFYDVRNSGYDSYFVIHPESMDTESDDFETTAKTTKGIASAFSKYNKSRLASRVVLNRFITLIA